MKKLSKIILSVAAATVVTAAMAVTAMAEDTINGTYDNETGVVTMEGVIGSGASQTLLVFKNAAEEITSNDIAYINQIDNITSDSQNFSTFTLAAGLKPTAASESVTYNIKVGGTDGTVQTGTLTIAGDAPATVTIVIGNVSGDAAGTINVLDLTQLGRKVKGFTTNIGQAGQVRTKADGSTITIGNVSGDAAGTINVLDLTQLGRKVKGFTTNIGQAGQTADVIDESAE